MAGVVNLMSSIHDRHIVGLGTLVLFLDNNTLKLMVIGERNLKRNRVRFPALLCYVFRQRILPIRY